MTGLELNPLQVNPCNVAQFRQNLARLVVRDAREILGLDDQQASMVAKILVARGVTKWLNCRKLLLHAKDTWKRQIVNLNTQLTQKNLSPLTRERLRGRLSELVRCREEVRTICKTNRWTLGADFKDEHFMAELIGGDCVERPGT